MTTKKDESKTFDQLCTFLFLIQVSGTFIYISHIDSKLKKKLIFHFFSVCNRTYYGDVGRTYAIRVPPPQWNRLPFLCHLTFTASGHDNGDIVQVSFSSSLIFFCTIFVDNPHIIGPDLIN